PGVLSIDVGPLRSAAGMAIQQDGTIALAATPIVGGHAQGILLRVTRDGRLADPGITPIAAVTMTANDAAITPDGKIVVVGGANAVLIQPDGKIVVAGTADSEREDRNSRGDFALARYLSDGRLDNSFGLKGKAEPIGALGLGPLQNGIGRATLDRSGRIVVGGF